MSQPVIKIENVSKMYRLGEIGTGTLTHDLQRTWAKLTGKPDPFAIVGVNNDREQKGGDYVWALKDINLEVKEGEILGIVGRNGAGKSTLLKLLSRVTAPTTGRILTKGRIASLLEVGTGFHPELTGRENIYLNGTILGMTRQEITQQLEEIIEFSGCVKYIDTPVKRYSSGMQVRLGFAVAAHLECEILIVDEVLAVGDADFQKKCIGKMQSIAKSGRTVLFVSHNLLAVQSLCGHSAYLKHGTMLEKDLTNKILDMYLQDTHINNSKVKLEDRKDRTGDAQLKFTNYWIENNSHEYTNNVICGSEYVFCFEYEAFSTLNNVYIAFDIRERGGESITNCNTADIGNNFQEIKIGKGVFRCVLPHFPIRSGHYTGNIYCSSNNIVHDFINDALDISIQDGDFYKTGVLKNPCIVMLDHYWSITENSSRIFDETD